MTERKLASIRRIKEIRPIPGADRIVCAVVDGWELVTQKSNNFQAGDLVVYFEIDSLLPICDQFNFLEPYRVSAKNSVEGEGYRLKTIKLRGQISQGLILPLDSYQPDALFIRNPEFDFSDIETIDIPAVPDPEEIEEALESGSAREGMFDDYAIPAVLVSEGDDVTELCGVKKYEKPIPAQLAGKIKGNFPSFLRKTDQERIQNCFNDFWNKWKDHEFEVTLKLDGSSFTAYYIPQSETQPAERFGVCSRNLDLLETDDNAFWQVARKLDLENKMKTYGRAVAIQGELMGPGVQGNRERLEELTMYVFDMYDIGSGKYLGADERLRFCAEMDLPHVPTIDRGVYSGFMDVKQFLQYAERPSIAAEQAEGVVFKSITNPEVSFKAISNAYLLGGGE